MGARGTDLAREAADLVLVDDTYPTIVGAVEGGRGLASQLRRAVAFYLGAKIALVVVIAVPLALGLPAPFHPVHIVVLELFMDVGASVAFVSEPTAPGTMDRPPRDPASGFLDGRQLSAIALTAVALTVAVLPAFLVVHARSGARMAIAAAVAGWLIANVAIAWSLRARPGLPLRRNVAFPVWALVALVAAFMLSLTRAGATLGVEPLTAGALRITAGVAGHPLLGLPGAGAITVARLIAEVGDVRRFRTADALAALAGVAPIPASSGQVQRMRLNRGGNRQLNRALHVIAVSQARFHPEAKAYVTRRIEVDGKTWREAIRALKRRLVRPVYRLLLEGSNLQLAAA